MATPPHALRRALAAAADLLAALTLVLGGAVLTALASTL